TGSEARHGAGWLLHPQGGRSTLGGVRSPCSISAPGDGLGNISWIHLPLSLRSAGVPGITVVGPTSCKRRRLCDTHVSAPAACREPKRRLAIRTRAAVRWFTDKAWTGQEGHV